MPDLLLEFFSEEIPARMQAAAAKDLERLVVDTLSDRGLMFDSARAFVGPRRLALAIAGLPAKQPDMTEERKGPRVGAPDKAIDGFLRASGVPLEQCKKQSDGKGEFYVAVIRRTGHATAGVLMDVLPEAIDKLSWPKSMRWRAGNFRWVRPLRSIVCTFDGEIVQFELANVKSGNTTFGHRFLAPGGISVRRFEDYEAKLRAAHVIIDAVERKETILHEARQKAFALGLELIEDDGLLEEVVGLAEWPVVFLGKIEEAFTVLPPEILKTSMRTHQKYFALQDSRTGGFANRFAFIAGTVASDGGIEIVAGNERVLRARLADARFFWEQDRKRTLESRVEDLKNIVFHAKLGTQFERVERIEALAGEIAARIGAVVERARRAARLCKADLTTEVVGEFPELQGVIGHYYALADGEDNEVADAIRDHYRPLGPSDAVSSARVSVAVALADKLDTLVGFFAICEKPTGSGDPYALRRAALGVIRLLLEGNIRLGLRDVLDPHSLFSLMHINMADQKRIRESSEFNVYDQPSKASATLMTLASDATLLSENSRRSRPLEERELGITKDVLSFVADRLKVALREKGTRHDLIDAVFSLGNEDDLVRLVARVQALQSFLRTDDGVNLLSGYRRAVNILRIEEKRDKHAYDGEPDPDQFVETEEMSLFSAIVAARELIASGLENERFADGMTVMAQLRKPVDAFFDKVTVNVPDGRLRENRLLLLSSLRAGLHQAADFSKIEG